MHHKLLLPQRIVAFVAIKFVEVLTETENPITEAALPDILTPEKLLLGQVVLRRLQILPVRHRVIPPISILREEVSA